MSIPNYVSFSMLSSIVYFRLFGCCFVVTAMLICKIEFVVQIGPKLLCVIDGIAGCLARQKTQTVGR